MSEPIVIFDKVRKVYPLYHHVIGGFKHFIFNLPRALHHLKHSQYEALKDLSFEIYRGETLGIIGRNGVGKSTTLGLIGGILKPTEGTVSVRGRTLPLLDFGAGFHPDLTGKENILLKGILLGQTKKQVLEKMDEIIAFADLGEFIDEPARVYSGGMAARLGFSVISCLDPDILLIDEVLGVGDIDFRKKCFEKIVELKKKGVTIVFVSHVLDDVLKICGRVLWIENHCAKMVGPAQAVVETYSKN